MLTSTAASHTTRETEGSNNSDTQSSPAYSETALVTALFGWSLLPPSPPQALRRVSTTRANSIVSTALPSPSPSRATSAVPTDAGAGNAPQSSEFTFRFPSNINVKPENVLLECGLCQRRIGLWSFMTQSVIPTSTSNGDVNHISPVNGMGNAHTESDSNTHVQNTPSRPKKGLPRRAFDLLKEHRSYCPYTVRSTVVPSLPLPTQSTTETPAKLPFIFNGIKSGNASHTSIVQFHGSGNLGGVTGALEGWRAVLTVVLRYRMAEKQRYNFLAPMDSEGTGDDEVGMDVDNVKAMINGVKTRGVCDFCFLSVLQCINTGSC